jgi:hypothetical protein
MISPSQRPLPHNTQHSQQTNFHAPRWFRTDDRSRRAAVDLRLRPRGYWDRRRLSFMNTNKLTDILSSVDKVIKSGSASNNTCQQTDIQMRHWTKSGSFNLENSCLLRCDAAVLLVVPSVTNKGSAFETSGILSQRHNAALQKT